MVDTLLFNETFDGTAIDFGRWTTSGSTFAIGGGILTISGSLTPAYLKDVLTPRKDSDVVVSIYKAVPTAGVTSIGLNSTASNGSTGANSALDGVSIKWSTNGNGILHINGVAQAETVAPAITGTNRYYRFRYVGEILQARSWTGTEGSTWDYTVDLSGRGAATTQNGNLIISANRTSSGTSVANYVSDAILSSATADTSIEVVTTTQTMTLQAPDATFQFNKSETIDLSTVGVSATAVEPTVEVQKVNIATLYPTSDYLVNSAGVKSQETAATIDITYGTGNQAGIFLFTLPDGFSTDGLISATINIGGAAKNGVQGTTTFGFAPITSVDNANPYNSTVGDEIVQPYNLPLTFDFTSSVGNDFKGIRVRVVTASASTNKLALDASETTYEPYKFRLELAYQASPNATVDVASPNVSATAVEPIIQTIDPVSTTVDLTTVTASLSAADASFEELRTVVLVPTTDGYRTQGGATWTNTGDVLSLNYSPTTNLSTVLVPVGNATEVATINRALERFDFPLEMLQAGIQAKYGRNYVNVSFGELGTGDGGGSVLGEFKASTGGILLDPSLIDTTNAARSTLIHEVGHLVDEVLLNNSQRVAIWNALHPLSSEKLSYNTNVVNGVPLSHGHYWSGGGAYVDRVEEAFCHAFIKAYSDVFFVDQFSHSATDAAGAAIRAIITPSLPAQLGPFPTRTPAVRLDFDPVPAGVFAGAVKNAVLTLNVTWNTGGQYTIRTIEPTGVKQNESADKVVSLTMGTNSINITDIFDPQKFDIIHIGNVKGSNSQTLNVTATEDTLPGTEPRLTITYTVNQGATVADADTASLAATTQEPVIDATTSPDAFVDADTPAIVIPEPQAQVVLTAVVDLTDTNTVMLGSYDPTVELTNSAIFEVDTPTLTLTRIPVADVNGEPVLPSETEDPYYVSTMRTLTGIREGVTGGIGGMDQPSAIEDFRQVWFRMNEKSGNVAKDRLFATAIGSSGSVDVAREVLTLDNVTVGLNDGPEGRHHFYFNGQAFAAQTPGTDVGNADAALEFTFRTTKKNQFIMGNADSGSGLTVTSPTIWELWMVDGKLQIRTGRVQLRPGSRDPELVTQTHTAFTDLADGEWHHVVLQAGYKSWANATLSGSEFNWGLELFVDSLLELRRRVPAVGVYGFPDHIGGRPGNLYPDVSTASRTLSTLESSQWYVGDMTEVVYRYGRALSPDEISRQRDAMFGIYAVWTDGARLTLDVEQAVIKGNKPRMLVLHFGVGSTWEERITQFTWEPNAMAVLETSPETLAHFDQDINTPRTEGVVFSGPGDHAGPYDTINEKGWAEQNITRFHEYVLSKEVGEGTLPFYGARKDEVTDNYRILDLELDLNMDDFDIISIVGYPTKESHYAMYDVLDTMNAEPYVPARKQLENLMGQIKDQVIEDGKGLFVSDPFSAIALGIIDQVDATPEYLEHAPIAYLDSRLGAINPGFDGRGYATDPFLGATPWKTYQEKAVELGDFVAKRRREAARYTDYHANHMQRVRALVPGLTDQPGHIITDMIEWMNVNPFNEPPSQTSIKYENKVFGLSIGDEFYIDAPTSRRGDLHPNSPMYNMVWKHTGMRVAAPISAIKVGTAVTSFLTFMHNGTAGADHAFGGPEGPEGSSDAVGNPFFDHAISIAIQPGDSWDGKTVQGKVYVNFTESMQMFAEYENVEYRQTWESLDDGAGLQIHDVVKQAAGTQFSITPQQAAYQFSTHYGTWGGTEINFTGKTKPDWGWSAGGTRGSGLSGGGGEAMNWVWRSVTPLVTIPAPTMSQRGMKWLATDVQVAGNAGVNTPTLKVATQANDVVVETSTNADVSVATARLNVESHNDKDTVDPDVTVLTTTGAVVLTTGGLATDVAVETAGVLLVANEVPYELGQMDWTDTIILQLPRQIVTLILEDN